MHRVVIVAPPRVVPSDLSMPVDLFSTTRTRDGRPAYDVRVCAASATVDAGAFRIQVDHDLQALQDADSIVVAGVLDVAADVPAPLCDALAEAATRGTRLASICTGAFVLAAAGVLDGRRATTHWRASELLARRYPEVRVDADVLFVDEGQILTSAGATAGLDLCLHLVERDLGSAVAAQAARHAVAPLRREGGQSQYTPSPPEPADETTLSALLEWIEAHAHQDLVLADLARAGGMSVRTLNRRFRTQLQTTPLQWLIRARLQRARALLETTDLSVERIAEASGFGSTASLRTHFRRGLQVSPGRYRRAFRLQR